MTQNIYTQHGSNFIFNANGTTGLSLTGRASSITCTYDSTSPLLPTVSSTARDSVSSKDCGYVRSIPVFISVSITECNHVSSIPLSTPVSNTACDYVSSIPLSTPVSDTGCNRISTTLTVGSTV